MLFWRDRDRERETNGQHQGLEQTEESDQCEQGGEQSASRYRAWRGPSC